MGGSSESSETGSAGTLVPGTRFAQGTAGRELAYGGMPSPPRRVKRLRPKALRGESSLHFSRTVSPAISLGDISLNGTFSRYEDGSSFGESGVPRHAPYVLVPSVTVTPEVDVVGGGETTMWIAVEVGAQLGRPDGGGAIGWNGWGSMDPGVGEYNSPLGRHLDGGD